jgi:hypothetical protein
VQYALAELWRSWGIEPVKIAGRGVGMLAAGAVARVFDVSDGLALAVARARWLDGGTSADTGAIEQRLRDTGFSSPRIPIMAGIGGEALPETVATPAFWLVATTGRCEDVPVWRPEPPWEYCIAIGAAASGDGVDPDMSVQGLIPGLDSRRDEWEPLLESLIRLYVAGVPIDWTGFDGGYSRRRAPLPTCPFLRTRYWFDASAPKVEGPQANSERLFAPLRERALKHGRHPAIEPAGVLSEAVHHHGNPERRGHRRGCSRPHSELPQGSGIDQSRESRVRCRRRLLPPQPGDSAACARPEGLSREAAGSVRVPRGPGREREASFLRDGHLERIPKPGARKGLAVARGDRCRRAGGRGRRASVPLRSGAV